MADFGFMGGQGGKGTSGARAGTRGMGVRGIGPSDSGSGGAQIPMPPSVRGGGGPRGAPGAPVVRGNPGYPAAGGRGSYIPPVGGAGYGPPGGGGSGYPAPMAGYGPPGGAAASPSIPGSSDRRLEAPRTVVHPKRPPGANPTIGPSFPTPRPRQSWVEPGTLDAYGASEDVEQRMQAFPQSGMPNLLQQSQTTESGSGAEVASLRTQVTALREELGVVRESLAVVRDETKVFYGLVDGGSAGVVLIYNDLPTVENPLPGAPAAKARRGRWLRLAHPKFTFQRVSESGPVTDTWFSVHLIDPKSGELSQKWVMSTTLDGSPSFTRFDVLPRDAQRPTQSE